MDCSEKVLLTLHRYLTSKHTPQDPSSYELILVDNPYAVRNSDIRMCLTSRTLVVPYVNHYLDCKTTECMFFRVMINCANDSFNNTKDSEDKIHIEIWIYVNTLFVMLQI